MFSAVRLSFSRILFSLYSSVITILSMAAFLHLTWVQLHNTRRSDLRICVPKVSLRLKAPLEVANNPTLHRHSRAPDRLIYDDSPARQRALRLKIRLHKVFEMLCDMVCSALEVEVQVMHENGQDVVGRVAFCLFHIVRIQVLSP